MKSAASSVQNGEGEGEGGREKGYEFCIWAIWPIILKVGFSGL